MFLEQDAQKLWSYFGHSVLPQQEDLALCVEFGVSLKLFKTQFNVFMHFLECSHYPARWIWEQDLFCMLLPCWDEGSCRCWAPISEELASKCTQRDGWDWHIFFQAVPLIFRHLSNLGKIHLGFYCKPQRPMITGCFRAASNSVCEIVWRLHSVTTFSGSLSLLAFSIPTPSLFPWKEDLIYPAQPVQFPHQAWPGGSHSRAFNWDSGCEEFPSPPCGRCIYFPWLPLRWIWSPMCQAGDGSGSDGWAETLRRWVRIPLDMALGSLPCSCAGDTAPLPPALPFHHHHHPKLHRQLHSIIHNLTESW